MDRNGHDIARVPLRDNPAGHGLLLAALALLAMGVVMVYSASSSVAAEGSWMNRQEGRHLIYAVLAAGVMLLLWRVDYRALAGRKGAGWPATVLLVVSLILSLVVMVPGVGTEVNGARRWFRFGSGIFLLSFQPSELVKIALVAFLACWLGREGRKVRSFTRVFVPAVFLLGVCVASVILEDFGTAAIVGMTAVAMFILAGIPWYYLLTLAPPAAAGVYFLVYRVQFRWARIIAFVNLWDEASRWTYQGRQALIAIGSGGLWGKGLGNGVLKRGFLPEDSTDFIFAILCEELGFVGAAVLLGLIAMLLYLSWRVASRSADRTGRLLAGGMGILITLQALMHVGVNLGSIPPTGLNLPLVSAGGTALVLMASAVAMIVSVSARNPVAGGGRSAVADAKSRGRFAAGEGNGANRAGDDRYAEGDEA